MDSLFHLDYKRYTPFSLDTVTHEKTNNIFKIEKSGDILMNLYLMYNGIIPSTYYWVNNIVNVEIYIGEICILNYPVKFLVNNYPGIMADTYSKSLYLDNEYFLPIPIPKIPLCALDLQDIKIIVNGNLANLTLQSTYVYLGPDDKHYMKNSSHDITIQQLQTKSVSTDGSICLSHPVKFLYSDDFSSDSIIIDGYTMNIPKYNIYYSYKYYSTLPRKLMNVVSGIQGASSTTSVSYNGVAYLFLTNSNIIYTFNGTTFGSILMSSFHSFTFSVINNNQIVACSETDIVILSLTGQIISEGFINGGNIDTPFAIVGDYIFGETMCYNYTTTNQIINYNKFGINFSYATIDSNKIYTFYTTDGKFYSSPSSIGTNCIVGITALAIPINTYSQLINTSGALLFNGSYYFAPIRSTDLFIKTDLNFNVIGSIGVNIACSGLFYDNNGHIFLIPRGDISVFNRFDISSVPIFNFFWSFATDTTSSDHTGSLNFSRIHNVSFPNVTYGTVYAVNYNVLRIKNGQASILYAT